ncbi:MAG: choloylglycine hydrolase [Firmicutes bacterium]|nr:choloylglycine hydrolase [Bacillota bacterium]
MCTAVSYRTKCHYFGRNLDIERGYHEGVVITPRKFPFAFRYADSLEQHYALIGMATVIHDYPLYFEATNEVGLSMAGLNFPKNAYYPPYAEGKINIAPFELIPYLLGSCRSVADARETLHHINVIHCNFSEDLPVSPLHWLISDREESMVLECTKDGMKVYDNPFGVLTNNPTFDYHVMHLNQYMGLSEGLGENRLNPTVSMDNFSLGFGGFGLPGDFSSPSRFVRAVFVKEKSVCDGSEKESVNQFFRILQSVAMPKGCVMTGNGEYEYTRYSCCCNTDTQTYYYTTYQNMAVRNVEMREADLDGMELCNVPLEE